MRVLHIVRDPRSYVTSHLNFSRQKGTSFIANYFVPFWQPNPFLVGELPLSKAIGFTRFEKYCWIWDFKNRVMEGLENTSTPYMRVRFEDLFNTENPEDLFGAITDFLGLPRVTGIREKFRQGARSNVFVERDGCLLTPPLCNGALPGVLRGELLAAGRAREAVLLPDDLAQGFWLGNALRGLLPVRLAVP